MTLRIAVDAMGGDHAPAHPVEGAVKGNGERGPQGDDEPEREDGIEALGDEIVRLAAWLQAKEA